VVKSVGDVFDAAFISVRSRATGLANVKMLDLLALILVARGKQLLAVVTYVWILVMLLIRARKTSRANPKSSLPANAKIRSKRQSVWLPNQAMLVKREKLSNVTMNVLDFSETANWP
jgi:hypothetical protein